MKTVYIIIAIVGLSLLIIPALMHYLGAMELIRMKNLMFLGTVIWFAGAIPWLGKKVKV